MPQHWGIVSHMAKSTTHQGEAEMSIGNDRVTRTDKVSVLEVVAI